MSLFLYLQVIKLEIESLFLILLVLHRFDVLNIVSNISVFCALILISLEGEGLSESLRILVVFESKVFQWNHIVLNMIVCTTGRAA